MAGLAALLTFGSERTAADTLDALSEALAPRGAQESIVEFGATRLLLRAELPKVHEGDGVVVIVDGIAETSGLIARYAAHGASGLLHGRHPYALILAEPDGVVLARHLDGPPLYYVKARGAVIAASEPGALLAAGVPPRPNDEIVARYLAHGACDETPATFIEGIRRVLPGQVVEIGRHTGGWAIRAHPPAPPRPDRVAAVKTVLAGDERIGVVLRPEAALPAAALLGMTLSERASVPVYSASFPGLGAAPFAAQVLGPVPDGLVKHRAVPVFADEIDVDALLADVGEPVPGLPDYLLWALARATGGEVDVLLTGRGHGPAGHLSRVADRIAARYGVTLRFPFRDLDDEELLALAGRTLPPASVRAVTGAADEPPLHEIVERLRSEIAIELLYPAYGEPDHEALARLADVRGARRAELDRLWRHYVLQRWLRATAPPPGREPTQARPAQVGGWQRRLIQTEPVTAGDPVADKFAWYLTEFATSADKSTRHALKQPWLLLVAAKPVAVAQGQARPLWDVTPGRLARLLVRLRGGDPWRAQVAIQRWGRARGCVKALRNGYPMQVSPPRRNACPPGDLAIIGPPRQPAQAARRIVEALRRTLPDDMAEALRGCAIMRGSRLMGWSGDGPPPHDLLAELCEDDPMGAGDERTPLLVATAAPRKQGRRPKRR